VSRRLSQPADLGALVGSADELAQAFVALSSDIALVIDDHGVITRVVQDASTPMAPQARDWVGQRWIETVTGETRRKVEMLLADVGSTGTARKRQVNHGCDGEADIPVDYTALRLGAGGPVLAVGRDLRTVASIQQRFQDTQQELERTYWRARQNEARYRLLFQVATDAMLLIDGQTLRVLDGNHAAEALLRAEPGPLIGRIIEQQFDASSRPALRDLLAQVCAGGQATEIHARLAGTHIPLGVAATPFRTPPATAGAPPGLVRVLLRVRANEGAAEDLTLQGTPLARLVDTTAEGLVVADPGGRVVVCNRAFALLAQVASVEEVQGQLLASWLGASHEELPRWMARVRAEGMANISAVALRQANANGVAAALEMDVTITQLMEGDQERFGFTLRACAPASRDGELPLSARTLALARAIDALCAEVGEAPLGTLVQRAEHLARGHLVREALNQRADNDDSTARELGISVQELTRLRRAHAGEPATPLS
jgi:transcriptional regulator PpsR